MKIKTSKKLQSLYDELSDGAYDPEYHSYSYKETNQIVRKHFEKLEKKLDNLMKI